MEFCCLKYLILLTRTFHVDTCPSLSHPVPMFYSDTRAVMGSLEQASFPVCLCCYLLSKSGGGNGFKSDQVTPSSMRIAIHANSLSSGELLPAGGVVSQSYVCP